MATYLVNAFSFNMVAASSVTVRMTEVSAAEAASALIGPSKCWGWLGHRVVDPSVVQGVGHADTARLFGRILDLDGIEPSRATVSLNPGDDLVLGQYSGPRLPEGATVLPEGASIRWLRVVIE